MADIVKGFREVVQDLLVPELKAVQAELRHLKEGQQELNKGLSAMHEEMHARFEVIYQEMNTRFEAVQKEMNTRFEAVHREIMEIKTGQADLKAGQKEILAKLDVDKRVTKLETLVEQILRKVA